MSKVLSQINVMKRRDFLRGLRHSEEVQSVPGTVLLVSEACFLNSAIYCRSCGDMCQERAIRFIMKSGGCADMIIDAELCTGCGDCVSVCPANALTLQMKSESKEASYA